MSELPETSQFPFSNLHKLSPIRQRACAAILGCIIGDAASRPLHWIYKQSILDELISKRESETKDFTFFPENHSPYYSIKCGLNSTYGETILAMLRSLSSTNGIYDVENWKKELHKTFGSGTLYEKAEKLRAKV